MVLLDRHEAIETARKALAGVFDVAEDRMVEKPYGWIFFCRDSGGANPAGTAASVALLEKSTGKLIRLACGYSTETSIKLYEAGCVAPHDWDIIVEATADVEAAARLLFEFDITYLQQEAEGHTTWRVPRHFTLEQLRERLSALPCRFNLGSLHCRQMLIERMRNLPGVRFELQTNTGYRNEA